MRLQVVDWILSNLGDNACIRHNILSKTQDEDALGHLPAGDPQQGPLS
jgi:hypothetical protein